MNPLRAMSEPAVVASRILAAMRQGDLQELETGLACAESLAGLTDSSPHDTEEQIELLSAIAGQLRDSIARFGRQLTPHLEGFEVHLSLLTHLAHRPDSQADFWAWDPSATVH